MTTKPGPGRIALASYIGSVIEWYDFNIYGLATALVFSKQFFPSFSEAGGTLAALAAFAVGFVARPVGALISGHFGDRVGRKAMLVASLLTMGVATTLIGLLPTYAAIGVWAPILLVVLRLVQGIGVGGEWGGAALMAVEHAPPNRRALYGAFPQIGIPSGILVSQLAFLLLTQVFSDDTLQSWAWRLPFLFSGVLIVVGLIVRASITETEEFERAREARDIARLPLVEVFRRSPLQLFAGSLLSFAGPTLGTFLSVYMVSYGTKQLHLSSGTMLWITVVLSLPWIAMMLFAGRAADRFGRKRMFVIGSGLAAVAVFPMFLMVNTAAVPLVFAGLLLMTAANSVINGAQPAMLTQMFPASVRYSGASICFQVGSIVGGGIVPLVAASSYARFGTSTAVAIVIGVVCLVSMLAVLPVRRELLDVGAPSPQRTVDHSLSEQ
ncbi:Predicted arabinose efflux permease, MFS family [Amycolatopsis sacchari]|uniref:Putative proline/betaine transporter n=1 Tax=Amycolatopsis sacchari TaxID=115433 RepID=A0A1I4AK55_9PSEU|nr:MFS transporter [Amycolatopsis sacchari]SFK56357.1 Predicted arabinose efflux permease, MFS family [Amycolatopsis sacchari]